MNPLTDRLDIITLPDGRKLEVVRPGHQLTRNSRLTREAFTKYEDFLRQALAAWPTETAWSIPPNISPNTFVCQLRDARRALLLFGYDPELQASMQAIDPEVAISLDPKGDTVWFRQRSYGKERTYKPIHKAVRRDQDISSISPLPSHDHLELLCRTLSARLVSGPFIYRGRVDRDYLNHLETQFDVAFAYDEQTDITTLI